MTVRECRASDYIRIHQLNRDSLGYDHPVEKTREQLEKILRRPTDKLFVACINDLVVGYVHGSDYECTYADPLKNIMALAVDEAYQGKGAGRVLLEAVESWARECGCAGVRLVSSFSRVGAHQFYLRCGYMDRKNQKNFIKIFPQ